MQSSINYYVENIAFHLKNRRIISGWIKEIIKRENKLTGNISFIFCNDEYLYDLNKRYLNHNTLTDIITFDYTTDNIISGDVYISLERVNENAVSFANDRNRELYRVMAHGILHLAGFSDHSESEKLAMTAKEDECLSVLDQKLQCST